MAPDTSIRVKICGVRTLEQARWAADGGADWVGVVLAASKRQVSIPDATHIVRGLGATPAVGVFANPQLSDVLGVLDATGGLIVQLSGRESATMVTDLASRGVAVWKAIHIPAHVDATVESVTTRMHEYVDAGATAILLDTAPTMGQQGSPWGGSGRSFDWTLAAQFITAISPHPVLLAGGLTPANVGAALAIAHPFGVDVSSGVETDGVKDRTKILTFLHNARATTSVGMGSVV